MRYAFMILLFLALTGCASAPVYNPVQASVHPEVLLNESGFERSQRRDDGDPSP